MSSKSSLKEVFTYVLLLAHTYMACTTLTNHSGTQQHKEPNTVPFEALYWRPFLNQQMPYTVSCVLQDNVLEDV